MKHTSLARMALATLLLVASTAPANAQSVSQLKQENSRLKAELRSLQAQGCGSPTGSATTWSANSLRANVESIRVGQRSNHPGQPDGHVTVTLKLQNNGIEAIALNYMSGSFRLVDEAGHEYSATLKKASGIPTATEHEADSTALLDAGESRSVTFSAFRVPSASDVLPRRFDVNATFIQLEDLGQGRIRKVRDFPVAFTNAPASDSGISMNRNTDPFPRVAEQLASHLLGRLGQ